MNGFTPLETATVIFAVQFVCVMALGLNSLNVNGGHRLLASLTSIVISCSWLASTYLTLIQNEPTALNVAAFILGGITGINSSMSAHPWLVLHLGAKTGSKP